MQLETIIYEKRDHIAVISFNRPEVLNAQNAQLTRDFMKALMVCEADSQVKVIILKGEGRAFCSGHDLSEEHYESTEELMRIMEALQDTSRAIMIMPKPVIAAIHGYALGSGCEWCMNCDIRIAAEGTKFGFPEARVGSTVTNGGTKMLPLLIGLGRAKELIFTTGMIDEKQAEEWGLVNKVVPLEKLEEEAIEMANIIIKNSSLSIAITKKSLNQGVYQGFEETFEREVRDVSLVIANKRMNT